MVNVEIGFVSQHYYIRRDVFLSMNPKFDCNKRYTSITWCSYSFQVFTE